MESSIGQRLKLYIEHLCTTNKLFAATIDVSRQQLESWTNQRAAVPLRIVVKIASKYQELNCRWLLTGHGNMLRDSEYTEHPDKLNPDFFMVRKAADLLEENNKLKEKYIRLLEFYVQEKSLKNDSLSFFQSEFAGAKG